ncbi:MAG: dihydroneopterin aldolase [Campylobacterota bacterium]|nr:dihydroneopterin aldolase [Campylobacterota bacterium]
MHIHIEALTCKVIIGLMDSERTTPQRVTIDMNASYTYHDSEHFIDYANITYLIEKHLLEKRYELLEEALLGVMTLICSTYPAIQTLFLKISKPDILPHCSVAVSHSWNFS